MVYAESRICPGECDAQTSLGFWETNELPNLGQTIRSSESQKKKKKKKKRKKENENRTGQIVDSAVPADHRPHYSFICTQVIGSKYCDLSLTNQFDSHCLHTVKLSNSSISNNSM